MKLKALSKGANHASKARVVWPKWERVKKVPAITAIPGNCFNNVAEIASTMGGQAITGWALRVWPRRFIEGEAHCVLRTPEGDLIDPTPHPLGETEIAFARDATVFFDGNGLATQPNRYVNIAGNKDYEVVEKLIAACRQKQEAELSAKHLFGLENIPLELQQDIQTKLDLMKQIATMLGDE